MELRHIMGYPWGSFKIIGSWIDGLEGEAPSNGLSDSRIDSAGVLSVFATQLNALDDLRQCVINERHQITPDMVRYIVKHFDQQSYLLLHASWW